MFDASLRRAKDRIGEPLAARMRPVAPAAITVLALLTGLGCAVGAAMGLAVVSLLLWLLSRGLDGLDGLLARQYNKQSDFGGYLDILLDYVVYAAVPLGLVLGHPTQQNYLALAIMLAAFYVNSASWMMLAAILEKRSAEFASDPASQRGMTTVVMPAGLVGATETIIAYSLFLLFPNTLAPLFLIFSVLVALTILQRFVWAWRVLR
jgi:phosphatidylglycerophosphate synthase